MPSTPAAYDLGDATPAREHLLATYSGRSIDVFYPTADQIEPIDLARGLARTNRWAGQSREAYTVAQHSQAVAAHFAAGSADYLWGLLHDAAEAYLWDCPAPIKDLVLFHDLGRRRMRSFAEIEDGILRAVAERFDLPPGPAAAIHAADMDERRWEQHLLFAPDHPLWVAIDGHVPAERLLIASQTPDRAADAWLERLNAALHLYHYRRLSA